MGTGVEFRTNNGPGTPTAQIDETPETTEERSVESPRTVSWGAEGRIKEELRIRINRMTEVLLIESKRVKAFDLLQPSNSTL